MASSAQVQSDSDHAIRCTHCGLTLHAGAIRHDRALVLASVCPRCDGTLEGAADSSVYLG